MQSSQYGMSNIKFGSYDPDALTSDLVLFKTVASDSWALKAEKFKVGGNDINLIDDHPRYVSLEP